MEQEQSENSSGLQELGKINEEYVGWLTSEDARIDYPVVQGPDNDYYLTHNFYKQTDRVGAIFMDYRVDPTLSSRHTIIYGHNMKDNSMFGTLDSILDGENNKQPIIITFTTPDYTYELEVFAAYQTKEEDWLQVDFASDQDFSLFIADRVNKSSVPKVSTVRASDKIVTLATCTNRDIQERTVVHAKLIKKGERE